MAETEEVQPRKAMNITRVDISRDTYGDKTFKANVYVNGHYNNEIKLTIDAERTLGIIDIISDLLLDAMTFEMNNMRDTAQALVEEKRLKELPPPLEGEAEEASDG